MRKPGRCFVEPFRTETVAVPTAVPLRGRERLAPDWWEAFDDEGKRWGRILQNSASQQSRISGVVQMSTVTALRPQTLVMQDVARHASLTHSFPFFTGLCEKRCGASRLTRTLSCSSQMIVVQKDWIDCACAL